ncbi:MAG: ACP S-malonyltransferase [Vibrionaceae bacterium]
MSHFAVVFPGQGSQSVGMLAELAEKYSVVKQTFASASSVLGYDLWQLVQQGPDSALNQTMRTQPALLTASVAIWRVWQEIGGAQPAFLAGHSLGEYSALVCAGVLDFEQAVKLVELRGQLMQEAVPEGTGAMSAIIGLDNDAIKDACQRACEGQIVAPVNFNSPGQVVIAGHKEAVLRANVLCKEAGAKRALPLPVSVPSHCLLMKPAADKLALELEKLTFAEPKIAVVNNCDVKMEQTAQAIKDALVRQLYSPVRWSECVQLLARRDVTQVIEMGPGKVLTGLAPRIVKELQACAVNDDSSLQAALAQVCVAAQ